jgi:hypothetical protein
MFVAMGRAVGNLDAGAQNKQLRVGVVMIAVALAAGVLMLRLGVDPIYRVLLALPLFSGTYGVYAGLTRVCGFTAMQGKRRTESGTCPVADKTQMNDFRRRGMNVILGSATIAAAATALLVLAR